MEAVVCIEKTVFGLFEFVIGECATKETIVWIKC